jgi:hypothetical protein
MTWLENPRPSKTLIRSALDPISIDLNSDEETFKWLQAAYSDRAVWMGYLGVDPIFDRYRSDRRFQELLRRIGLV